MIADETHKQDEICGRGTKRGQERTNGFRRRHRRPGPVEPLLLLHRSQRRRSPVGPLHNPAGQKDRGSDLPYAFPRGGGKTQRLQILGANRSTKKTAFFKIVVVNPFRLLGRKKNKNAKSVLPGFSPREANSNVQYVYGSNNGKNRRKRGRRDLPERHASPEGDRLAAIRVAAATGPMHTTTT